MEEKKNTPAVIGFVFGIISFLLGGVHGLCFITLVLAIIGIVKSVKGMKLANLGNGKKALAIIGLILSILGVLVSLTGIGCTALVCTGVAAGGAMGADGLEELLEEIMYGSSYSYYYY